MNIARTPVLVVALGLAGCVSQGKYDQAVAQTATTRAELSRRDQSLAQTQSKLTERDEEAKRLAELVDKLTSSSTQEKTSNEERIAELRKRLDALRAAQAVADARAALFRDVAHRLQRQVDSGDLEIIVRDGRMVLALPNDVLFDSGKTELKSAGKNTLVAVAEVLKTLPDRQFQIAGHTDDVPIKNAPFASNWELSSGRALGVVHFLIDKGVAPAMLSAAGYGEIDPVVPNDSPAARKRNRRMEITLQPQIDDYVRIP